MSRVAQCRFSHLTDSEVAALHAYLRTVAQGNTNQGK